MTTSCVIKIYYINILCLMYTCTYMCSYPLPAVEFGRGYARGAEDEEQGTGDPAGVTAGQGQPGAAHPGSLLPQETQHLCRE